MRFYSQSTSSLGTTDWIETALDDREVSKYIILIDIDGDATVDLEFSIEENPADTSPIAVCHNTMRDLTSSVCEPHHHAASGFRLNVTRYNSGTITMKIIQS